MCAHVSDDVVSKAFTTSKQLDVYMASAGNTVKSTKTKTSLRIMKLETCNK